ncbi:hypothetical protein G7Y79_00015g039320 [Physcia stellaris]|nr:hypothetical protein G7Y79_00015g039320 [Physcia stellaris]
MFRSSGGLDAILQRPDKRPTPPWWSLILSDPVRSLAQLLYNTRNVQPRSHVDPIKVVCISDTHNDTPTVPEGDLLLHAGDLTQGGSFQEVSETLTWLRSLPHPHKIVIAGNHDFILQSEEKDKLDWGEIIYLQESSTRIEFENGRILNIYGSPWSRKHGSWAFEYAPHQDLWTNNSPQEADIFITHMPPKFHLDINGYGEERLLHELWRVRPRLHVFGHIHGGYGQEVLTYDDFNAAYETVRRRKGGVGALFKMLRAYLGYLFSSNTVRNEIPRTTLVNAAIVGGLRDDQRRDPITVYV